MAGASAAIVALVRRHAGFPAAEPYTPFKRNLGVDYAPLRQRKALKRGSVMANRLNINRKKLAKVKILRAAAGKHRTQSLFFTNLLPSMAYGTDVTGLSPTELRARESLALAAVGPYSRGCSRTIKNAVHQGLIDHHSVAVTIRLATEV